MLGEAGDRGAATGLAGTSDEVRRRARRGRDDLSDAHGVLAARLGRCRTALDQATAWRTLPRTPPVRPVVGEATVAFDDWLVHVRYARERGADDRDRLVERYRGYAERLAVRMFRGGDGYDDLEQVALEALLASLDRFDPERGTPFPPFAIPTIVGALKRYYRDTGWSLRVPRRVHELAGPARTAADELVQRLGRAPSHHEVAVELGVDVEDLLRAEEAGHARATASVESGSVGGTPVGRLLAVDDRELTGAEDRLALERAVAELPDRDREILDLYFGLELSQAAIAERYGVSQMQVSRWIRRAVDQLRDHFPT